MRVGLNLKILKIAGRHADCGYKVWKGCLTSMLVVGLLLNSCSARQITASPTGVVDPAALPKPAVTVISELATASPTLGPTASLMPTPTATLAPSATPDPYQPLTIPALVARSYGGGQGSNEQVMAGNGDFYPTLFTTTTEGVEIYCLFGRSSRGQPP